MKNKIIVLLGLILWMGLELCGQHPVASYSFYNLEDESGEGNELELDGSPIPTFEWEDCRRYLDFEDNAYARVDNPNISWDSSFSVAFWMRTSNTFSDQKLLGQASPDYNGFVIGIQEGYVRAEVFGGAPSRGLRPLT